MTRLAIATCVALAVALSGCSPGGGGNGGANRADKRAVAAECLREREGLEVSRRGRNGLQVGDAATGPRIDFYVTQGEAEARQLRGDAEGAELIGIALLYVRGGDDEVLEKVEKCLADV